MGIIEDSNLQGNQQWLTAIVYLPVLTVNSRLVKHGGSEKQNRCQDRKIGYAARAHGKVTVAQYPSAGNMHRPDFSSQQFYWPHRPKQRAVHPTPSISRSYHRHIHTQGTQKAATTASATVFDVHVNDIVIP
ncbi:hypothetical protein ASPCAL04504 [Aspergillus calidoustus]|uniref:Uncharacterized protein n=1 Tax=Aspergillus calidoustus TaxID=454130 RepID=A0A0U5GRB0_ASPCI|nr:hypothetical protein ASPCAL04504 [Aspergillus calidoustus]